MPQVTKAVVVKTFVLENYGDSTKPHWKRKGGTSKWVANVHGEEKFLNVCNFASLIEQAAPELETRNSLMFIEMVQEVDVIAIEDAQRRAAINKSDPMISSDDFFAAIDTAAVLETYTVGRHV